MELVFETPKQLAQRLGWPDSRVRKLINCKRLRHHRNEGKILIPMGAIEEYFRNTEIAPIKLNDRGIATNVGEVSK